MYSHVCLEASCLREALPTCTTCVWLFTCVYSHVCLEGSCHIEALPTCTTCVWLFTCVYSHVCFEGSCHIEALPTCTTCVWLLPCVDSHVCLEVSWLSEALPTCTTCVRLFPCVYSQVSCELSQARETFITYRTGVWSSSVLNALACLKVSTLRNARRWLQAIIPTGFFIPSAICPCNQHSGTTSWGKKRIFLTCLKFSGVFNSFNTQLTLLT